MAHVASQKRMTFDLNQIENFKGALPTKKDEAWKFTSLSEFKGKSWIYESPEDSETLTHDQMQSLSKNLPSEFFNLVFVNGKLNATLSDELTDFIEIGILDFVEMTVDESHVEAKLIKFANQLLRDQINISVSAHRTLEKPIHIVFVNHGIGDLFTAHRVNIHAGKNSEFTVITNCVSSTGETIAGNNLYLNVSADEQARVKVIQLQNQNLNSYHFAQTEVQLSSDTDFTSFVLSMGSKLSRSYLNLQLNGHQANAKALGLNTLSDSQHADHYTFINHVSGGNNTIQHYKSVLADASHSVFRGRVRIAPDAQKANSEQLNNNLLLTREAQADSVPQLEIFADDVKAGHGSTVGQLNKDEIFYFLSRGINQYQAVRMLSAGFAQELVYQFENKFLQEWLLKKLNTKLDGMIKDA